jgi:hypothetical protein
VMVKLLDFGIAKLTRAHKIEKTATGNMLGTPRYISPEQARGIDVTHRSDIYSLGVMAYEMLAGRPPFQGETAMDLVVKHLSEAPPPLSQFTRVPRSLEQCVMRMIEKDPARRPTLAEVRQILVDPSHKLARPFRTSLVRRAPLIAGAVALVAGTAFVAWRFTRSSATVEPLPPAPPQQVAQPVAKQPEVAPPPAPPPATTLEVAIGNNAKSATVFVDGVRWDGKREIAAGEHDVEVRANGNTVTRHIAIAAGQSLSLVLDAPAATVKPPAVRPPVQGKKPPVSAPPPATNVGPPPPKLDDDTVLAPRKDKK